MDRWCVPSSSAGPHAASSPRGPNPPELVEQVRQRRAEVVASDGVDPARCRGPETSHASGCWSWIRRRTAGPAAAEGSAPGSGVPCDRRRDVAEELADAVAGTGTQVLVIGLRRRTAVGKLLLGSAAQRILLTVDCPVLAVEGPPATTP